MLYFGNHCFLKLEQVVPTPNDVSESSWERENNSDPIQACTGLQEHLKY